jgi:Protein of unknown function (DUF2971)
MPGIVWHYTSGANFVEILKSNELWFTHVSCLNDSSEVNISIEHTKAVVEKFRNGENLPGWQHRLLDAVLAGLLQSSIDSRWYVSCFSECKDDLGQWRAYGGGEGGVAIGFDASELVRYFSESQNSRSALWPVEYDTEKLCTFGNELVQLTISSFENDFLNWQDQSKAIQEFLELWGDQVDYFSIIPKHSSFKNEKEWRLAKSTEHVLPNDRVFLANQGLIKRKIRVRRGSQSDSKFKVLPIVSVFLGPARSAGHNMASIKEALHFHGHNDVELKHSTIPFQYV